jgi:Holliday junction resolvase RusA-like endonuclease
MRAFRVGDKIATQYPPAVWAWRHQVQQAVADRGLEPFKGAVKVDLGFDLPRPANHWLPVNSRRSEPALHPMAPHWPIGIPDVDKLTRAILDACTDAGLWKDDSQVVYLQAAKRYTTHGTPGVLIGVAEVGEEPVC